MLTMNTNVDLGPPLWSPSADQTPPAPAHFFCPAFPQRFTRGAMRPELAAHPRITPSSFHLTHRATVAGFRRGEAVRGRS